MSCQHGNPNDFCDICKAIDDAWLRGRAAGVADFDCIGVIDSEGNVYPEPPEAGEQMFIKRVKP